MIIVFTLLVGALWALVLRKLKEFQYYYWIVLGLVEAACIVSFWSSILLQKIKSEWESMVTEVSEIPKIQIAKRKQVINKYWSQMEHVAHT